MGNGVAIVKGIAMAIAMGIGLAIAMGIGVAIAMAIAVDGCDAGGGYFLWQMVWFMVVHRVMRQAWLAGFRG